MSGHDIARDADVLLHDGQYRDHEYGAHVGWGHSSIGDAMEFANKADVDKLVLFHHDPYHTDTELEALLVEARGNWPGMEERVCLAHEGMTIDLAEAAVTFTG
jgi:ribonuclease BN (tRNA processing enzyme)